MYANKEDALKDENVLDTQTTNNQGIATFKNDIYYGRYIKESQTIKNYQIRNKEKDIISVEIDNGVRFLGEMTPDKMKVTSINQDGKEKTLDSSKNVNQELQSLVDSNHGNFNSGTNWLVFNDNGKEKLVSKKPLKYGISWNSLYNAGVVFDEDGVKNANFEHDYYKNPSNGYKINDTNPDHYKPTYVTVNNKKYIVRLMRGYNEKMGINNHPTWSLSSTNHYNAIKGSEWNRLILPLIDSTKGRYGSSTKKFVEDNMPTLANYSWWIDFGGNNNSSGNYSKGRSYGTWRWMQETGYDGSKWRALRGYISSSCGAADAHDNNPGSNNSSLGWLAVLERVDK